MSDSQNLSSSSSVVLQQILDLFVTAGYSESRNSNLSVTDLLTEGLAWCIAAAAAAAIDTTKNPNSPDVELVLNKSKVLEDIEAALRSIGCPYVLQARQIQELDYNGIYSVVQWVVDRIQTNTTKNKNEVSYVMREIEREEGIVEQLKKELEDAEHSIEILNANLNEQNMRIAHILNASQDLRVKLDKEGDKAVVERLTLLFESLKVLENKESDSRSYCKQNDSSPQDDVIRLEKEMLSYEASKSSFDDFGDFSCDPLEKLKSAKTVRAFCYLIFLLE
ncbi:hypothetical protein FRX31_023901 [Thalictrum thalictroides]|uniref:CCDC93 N-terminal domain-containing protein n=1 Tax=Thalictrum thalictroides TaxID=46969 RepID=A0A7J6VQ77_THATH|nr:hypothetical protein FRX31_023901 [Thalictrum thalictroides]